MSILKVIFTVAFGSMFFVAAYVSGLCFAQGSAIEIVAGVSSFGCAAACVYYIFDVWSSDL